MFTSGSTSKGLRAERRVRNRLFTLVPQKSGNSAVKHGPKHATETLEGGKPRKHERAMLKINNDAFCIIHRYKKGDVVLLQPFKWF